MTQPAAGYTRKSSREVDRMRLGILSVDLINQTAQGQTRLGNQLTVNISYPVGGVHVNPAVGEQWYVIRFEGVWRLDNKIPFNDPVLLVEDKEGQVKVGSGTGPLELVATETNVHGTLGLGDAQYRDQDGRLERKASDGDWLPVIPSSDTGFVISTDITDSSATGRAVLTGDAAAGRTALGAGTSNLAIGTSGSTAKAGNWLPVPTDISGSSSVGRSILTAADAAAVKTLLDIEDGLTILSENISDSTDIGRDLLTAFDAAAARAFLELGTGVATNSEDILDSTSLGRALLTAASVNAARAALNIGPRVVTITSNATPTVNADIYDRVNITALATAITNMSTNLTGTFTEFQPLVYRIRDNGTPRAINWGTLFTASGVTALPITTLANKTHTFGFFYDDRIDKFVLSSMDDIGYA